MSQRNSNALTNNLNAVQLSETIEDFANSKPLGSILVEQNQTRNPKKSRQQQPVMLLTQVSSLPFVHREKKPSLSQVQSGIEKYGFTTDMLQKNMNLFEIEGKLLSDNKFKNSLTNVPSIDSMLDEDQDMNNFEKSITSHYGGFY